jgi:hypothetical protein
MVVGEIEILAECQIIIDRKDAFHNGVKFQRTATSGRGFMLLLVRGCLRRS